MLLFMQGSQVSALLTKTYWFYVRADEREYETQQDTPVSITHLSECQASKPSRAPHLAWPSQPSSWLLAQAAPHPACQAPQTDDKAPQLLMPEVTSTGVFVFI